MLYFYLFGAESLYITHQNCSQFKREKVLRNSFYQKVLDWKKFFSIPAQQMGTLILIERFIDLF